MKLINHEINDKMKISIFNLKGIVKELSNISLFNSVFEKILINLFRIFHGIKFGKNRNNDETINKIKKIMV